MTVRQEVLSYIDTITEERLEVLRPLLHLLANEALNIETDLTEKEKAIIAQGRIEYAANPNSFVSLD
ncbi:hypothetical protein FACS18949_14380 [Clostridia bacterium]|nr:hypothetical protein FACS189425_07190 [Clostridia bacterium]GHV35768.1 hypothetical protein FACS18949_14380 [Clostridia bacterium]